MNPPPDHNYFQKEMMNKMNQSGDDWKMKKEAFAQPVGYRLGHSKKSQVPIMNMLRRVN